jgi:hypothetical protein
MTFEDHLEATKRADGSYDLAAATVSRAAELATSSEDAARLAKKAAQAERAAWEARETRNLRKMFSQPALSPDLELDALVLLGDNTAVRYGAMDHSRIRLRKDMRTQIHRDEFRAFDTEMTHWEQTEALLTAGATIEQYLAESASPEVAGGQATAV